jgi:F-type H+-transporting ATPase subunit b
MVKQSFWTRLLALVAVCSLLLTFSVALAQEGAEETPAAEAEAAAEGEAAAEESAEGEAAAEEGEAGEAEAEEGEAAAVSPLAPLGINQGFLIAQIVNFLLIAGALTFFLWRPMVNMLDSRAAKIEKGLSDAAAAAQARQNAEAEAEKIRAEARAETVKIVEDARGRADELAKSIEAEARKEAERIVAEARVRANEERDRQLTDLRSQVIGVATAMATRLIGDSVDEARQSQIVSNFLANVPSDAAQLNGEVEVVSAMPLSEAEQGQVRAQLSSASAVSFSVNPSILGGLIIRSGDRVVDASVRSNLTELTGRLR